MGAVPVQVANASAERKRVDITHAGHDLGGVEDPDTVKLRQGGPDDLDGGIDVGGGFGNPTVECADLGDKVSGQAAHVF